MEIFKYRSIIYKKVKDLIWKKKWHNSKKKLCRLGTLEDDESILGIYKENRLEDFKDLIAFIGLMDDDKVIKIYFKRGLVYTWILSRT